MAAQMREDPCSVRYIIAADPSARNPLIGLRYLIRGMNPPSYELGRG
jgi:hypothetical protein